MAAFLSSILGFLCVAQSLTAAEPVPGSAPAASVPVNTADQFQRTAPAGSDPSAFKSKMPQRSETLESLFGGSQSQPMSPLTLPSFPSPRTKRLLDDKENWVFTTTEDVIEDFMTKEKLAPPQYTADGREKSSLSPVERYYYRQNASRGATNSASEQRDSIDDMENPDFVSGSADISSRKNHSLPGLENLTERPNRFADLIGADKSRSLADSLRDQEERLQAGQIESFKKLYDFPQMPDSINKFNPSPTPVAAPAWNTLGDAYANPGSPNGYVAPAPGFTPSASPGLSGIPAVPGTPSAPGLAPAATLPPSVTETRASPPKVNFSAPMRQF
jgi:hypothetical protein